MLSLQHSDTKSKFMQWGSWLMRYSYMICPAHDLGINAFSDVRCETNPVFLWRQFSWPGLLNDTLKLTVRNLHCAWNLLFYC